MSSTPPVIEELRLTRFKSFHDATLRLGDLTLLIGRNGSGKSNAIESLETLALLAGGDDVRDSIEGSRLSGTAIRGGVAGCAPYGETSFALGCTVRAGEEQYLFDVVVQCEPDVQVVFERLRRRAGGKERDLLVTEAADPERADIRARYVNGRRGPNPAIEFRASRLLLTQIGSRVPASTKAERALHAAAETVVRALRSVFVLDPVPHVMRDYVPARDVVLRRGADNISAVVARLRRDDEVWSRLQELVRSLPEQEVDDITVESSRLGDVIIALLERHANGVQPVSARLISDGMLRFIAFTAALLEAPLADADAGEAQTTLVIEELENGLHPSQARRVVGLIKEEARRRKIRALATTHSPAMLSALDASDHPFVIVCDRDPHSGRSRVRPLPELPGYARAMARGPLGDAVTHGRLNDPTPPAAPTDIDRLLAGL